MAQEMELSEDYATIHELQGTKTNRRGIEQSGASPAKSKLLRIGILTLGVLCILQATLNISLRLAFYSKEDADQFPFNSSIIADMFQCDQYLQNSTQSCSCCKDLLRRLLREYQALGKERVILPGEVRTGEDDQGSGSGSLEEFHAFEYIDYSDYSDYSNYSDYSDYS